MKSVIERLASMGEVEHKPEARAAFLEFRDALTQGKIRAAERKGEQWIVNAWVKQGILLGFRLGELAEMRDGPVLSFVDKDTFPARHLPWRIVYESCPEDPLCVWALSRTVRNLHAADVYQCWGIRR